MKLTDHIQHQEGTATPSCPILAGIATVAGCSAGTLYMIAMGHKQAGPKLALRIAAATKGEVSVHDLRPDVFGPAPSDQAEAA